MSKNILISVGALCCFICTIIVILAIVLPIGIINSIPPKYCYSTDNLKHFPIGSKIILQKEFGLSRFAIFNETVNEANRLGRMKFRSWAIPYRIDLMTPEDLGSCEASGTVFSLGQKVAITVCNNDTEVPFQTLGRIDQEFSFLFRKYKLFNGNNEQVAHAEENPSFVTIDIDIKSTDGSLVYAKVATKPFVNLMETWEVTVKAELPDFDWRVIMYLVSVISYNRQK